MRKKSIPKPDDDMHADYKRSDFGVMERGKYVRFARLALKGKFVANTDVATTPENSRENADS